MNGQPPSGVRIGGRRRATRAPVFVAVLATAAVLLPLPGSARLAGQGKAADPILKYGLSTSLMTDVSPTDALAASLLFSRTIGRAVGAWDDAQATLYSDSDTIVRALNASAVDFVALSALEYLGIERQVKADPFIIYQTSGEVASEYVLVASDAIRSVADVAGKRVAVFKAAPPRDLGDTWLDVLLAGAGLADGVRGVQVREMKKRSQASVAVFFGQADAAIEPRSAFAMAAEMNPQLGKKLRVLATSVPLLSGIVVVRRSMDPDLRRRYLEKATTMHEVVQYRQTFLVMHVNQLLPFEPRYLAGTRQLNERYLALRKSATTR
jgi:ABC-type phosphate/phosphonate transport system substrate-binding protein